MLHLNIKNIILLSQILNLSVQASVQGSNFQNHNINNINNIFINTKQQAYNTHKKEYSLNESGYNESLLEQTEQNPYIINSHRVNNPRERIDTIPERIITLKKTSCVNKHCVLMSFLLLLIFGLLGLILFMIF